MFAVTFLHEFMYATKSDWKTSNLSEEYLNYAANLVTKQKADGDFFANIEKGYETWGVCDEQKVPYQSTFNPNLTVSQNVTNEAKVCARLLCDFIKPWDASKGASQAELDAAVAYLNNQTPVAAGLLWPAPGQFKTQLTGGVDLMIPPSKQNVVDGHSVALVGYTKNSLFPGGGYFIFRNSWGPSWGDQGYGYMPFDYILKYANDLFAYKAPHKPASGVKPVKAIPQLKLKRPEPPAEPMKPVMPMP